VEGNTSVNGNQLAEYPGEKNQINCYRKAHNQDAPCSGLDHDCPLHHVLLTGRPYATRQVLTDPSGRSSVIEVYGYPIFDKAGNVRHMVEYVLDITERLTEEVRASIRMEEQTRLAAQVFDNTSEGIIITDSDGEIVSVNRSFTQITGYLPEEAIGKTPNLLKSGRHDDEFYARMWAALNDTGQWRGEIWNRRKDGDIYPEWLTISAVKDDQGEVINYMAIFIDISQRIQNEALLKYLATHDPLTKIPNRALFKNRLLRAMARSQRSKKKVAILMLDLDEFKGINDRLGHAAGDMVLQKWAERLKSSVRESDTVARLGGDEFSIILEGIASKNDAKTVVDKILERNKKPFALNGHSAKLTASIGITLFPDDGIDYAGLLINADQAMYVAKNNGKNRYAFFSRDM
jgi:diguanylate cyclase (GGDEF)-like protein/PAS domain S-box-containing protein